jgi:hypothetical protein
MRGTLTRAVLLLAFIAPPVFAEEDDDWDESRWEELDEPKKDTGEEKPMLMGPHTLPAGSFGLRLSGGLMFTSVGAQFGLLDRLDLIVDAYAPWKDLGNTWMVGGGAKVNLHGRHSTFAYAFTLKAYGIFYSDVTGAVAELPEGVALWPTFMIGMKIKEGCFYGEIGPFLFVHNTSQSTNTYVFQGVPAHFGGEIYITDMIHIFINVDIIFSGYFGIFTMDLTGPFNTIEAGVVFVL